MATILMHYAEVCTYLDRVRMAVDAQRSALGFWPPAAYEQAAFQERLWVMVDEDRKYLGHILFGAARPSIRVFQISVEAEARGHGVASELISALESFGERNGYMSVLARVAAELPSNHFWDRSGYLVLRQVPGMGGRQRTINVRGKQLRIASLFEDGLLTPPSPAIRYSERPLVAELNYVLDLNVVFDLKKHRAREYAARRVIKLALSGPYRLFIAREAVIELERTSIDPSHDSVLSFTSDLPCLPDVPQREISGVLAELTEVLHPGKAFAQLNPNDRSDILHLGQSIHHRVRGFITSDGLMLRAQQTIHQRFGIEVISPFDLVFEAGALSTYSASVEAGTLKITELSEQDRRKVEEFLTSIGVPAPIGVEALQPVMGGTNRTRRIAIADNSIIGYVSWDNPPTPNRFVRFFADEAHPTAIRVVDTVLSELMAGLPHRKLVRIDLQVLSTQIICRETARLHGYQESSVQGVEVTTQLCKMAYQGPLVEDDWSQLIHQFQQLSGLSISSQLLPFSDFANTGIAIGKGTNPTIHLRLFEFETLLSPVIVLPRRRTSVFVPIKFSYAESLLGISSKQPSLLPKKEAGLCLERAYFRSSRSAKTIAKGDLVVFYVSEHDYGGKEVVAAARVTSSMVMTAGRAAVEYSRQGVVELRKLRAMAGDKDQLHAFTFDSVTLFPNPVGLATLRAKGIIDRRSLVGLFRLDADKTQRLFRLGFRG